MALDKDRQYVAAILLKMSHHLQQLYKKHCQQTDRHHYFFLKRQWAKVSQYKDKARLNWTLWQMDRFLNQLRKQHQAWHVQPSPTFKVVEDRLNNCKDGVQALSQDIEKGKVKNNERLLQRVLKPLLQDAQQQFPRKLILSLQQHEVFIFKSSLRSSRLKKQFSGAIICPLFMQ